MDMRYSFCRIWYSVLDRYFSYFSKKTFVADTQFGMYYKALLLCTIAYIFVEKQQKQCQYFLDEK